MTMRSPGVALLAALALGVGACGSIDTPTPAASGPCEITTLDPADTNASFASGAACVIVAWDTTRFPSAFTVDGGTGDPVELLAAAEQAGYLHSCSLTVFPVDPQDASVTEFAARFGRLTPKARQWSANLFLLDHRDGAAKGYCRNWLGIP